MKNALLKRLSFAVYLLLGTTAYSQSIQKQVIGSSGGTLSSGDIELDATTGEVTVSTINSGNFFLYQGYHHEQNAISTVNEFPLKVSYKLYPNPTVESVTLEISAEQSIDQLTVKLFDINGKELSVKTQQNILSGRFLFDVSSYSSGQYFLKITGERNTIVKTLKITKQ